MMPLVFGTAMAGQEPSGDPGWPEQVTPGTAAGMRVGWSGCGWVCGWPPRSGHGGAARPAGMIGPGDPWLGWFVPWAGRTARWSRAPR